MSLRYTIFCVTYSCIDITRSSCSSVLPPFSSSTRRPASHGIARNASVGSLGMITKTIVTLVVFLRVVLTRPATSSSFLITCWRKTNLFWRRSLKQFFCHGDSLRIFSVDSKHNGVIELSDILFATFILRHSDTLFSIYVRLISSPWSSRLFLTHRPSRTTIPKNVLPILLNFITSRLSGTIADPCSFVDVKSQCDTK